MQVRLAMPSGWPNNYCCLCLCCSLQRFGHMEQTPHLTGWGFVQLVRHLQCRRDPSVTWASWANGYCCLCLFMHRWICLSRASGSDESEPSRPSVAFSRVPILEAVPVKSHIRESNTHILSVFIAPTSAPRHGGSTSTSLPNITLFTYASSPRFTRPRTDRQGSYGHLWVTDGSIWAGPLSVTVSRWM